MIQTTLISTDRIPAGTGLAIGRDAFEFVRRLRQDPQYAETYQKYLRREQECREKC